MAKKSWYGGASVFVLVVVGMAAVVTALAFSPATPLGKVANPPVTQQKLSSFQSYDQLVQYVSANAKSAQAYSSRGVFLGGTGMPVNGGLVPGVADAFSASAMGSAVATTSASFTGTNVQVQGVDEPDRVKTDGTHLFVSTHGSVSILDAYPPNSTKLLSSMSFSTLTVIGLEVIPGRLMVLGQAGGGGYWSGPGAVGRVELLLYDVSDLSAPRLIQNDSVTGTYVAARMAGGYVYAVIQQPSYLLSSQGNTTALMPTFAEGGVQRLLSPSSVYYTPIATQVSYYTMIPSMSMATGNESVVSVLTGPSSTMYVSPTNIYVVYTNYLDLYAADGIPGDFFSGGVIDSQTVLQSQNSTVVRIAYLNGTVTVAKAGVVPGTVLNQFSMDEYDGRFRIATSRFAMIGGTATTSDDVYVLDKNMSEVSALCNIAPGENIYAVRFVGQMGYVVTFEQIDPLFVISFKDMSNPVILSALKVSGYSDYLHPLPGGYLMGVGKDAVPASTGNFSYYLGLKLSLFRVFSNGTSVQVSKMLIGDRGTDSPVLSDHLAFTYDSTRNLTVIPLTLYKVTGNQTYDSGFPPYGDPAWQGVYVIRVTSIGFTILGTVTQYPQGQNFGDSNDYNLQVDRSVIIGNCLYTISQSEVMVSSLDTFATLGAVQIPG